jgi:hypothetical protein
MRCSLPQKVASGQCVATPVYAKNKTPAKTSAGSERMRTDETPVRENPREFHLRFGTPVVTMKGMVSWLQFIHGD